jgi:hypothetical protein
MTFIAAANVPVRVTALSGERQTFQGLGINHWPYGDLTSQETRDTLQSILADDMDFRMFRFYRVYITGWTNRFIVSNFRDPTDIIRKHAKARGRNVDFLFNPTGTMADYTSWGNRIAEVVDTLEKAYSTPGDPFYIKYTGIGNEVNQNEYTWAAPMTASDIPQVVKATRAALDARGLQHVKIIACGASNVDNYMLNFIKAMKADAQALNDLYAWEYHSYNMSITQDVYTSIASFNKPIFQTESSLPEGDIFFNDSQCAAQTMCRILADMNFGVEYWLHWIGWNEDRTPGNDGAQIMWYSSETGEIVPYEKFYYFRQLSRTFVPGTKIRKCVTNLKPRTKRKTDSLMEYTYGLKIPIAASAGLRPDGSWAMAVVNHTGLRFTSYGSTYYPKDDYDVTFYVPELAGAGDMQFKVWRCNYGTQNVLDSMPATMHNGEVTVTVRHCDLVCLSTSFNTTFMPLPSLGSHAIGGSCGGCGQGIVLAFLPPVGFSISSIARRLKKKSCHTARNGN